MIAAIRIVVGLPFRLVWGTFNVLGRLTSLLLAVLDKRVGLNLATDDVFVNVAGGLSIEEPAADLAVLSAVASSLRNKPIAPDVVVFGEVGVGVQASGHGAHEVEEAGVAFDLAEGRHLDAAVLAHAPEVIAQEIGDHHQFGDFLGAGLEFVAQLRVARRIGMPRPGSLDRPRLNLRTAHPQE